jgi:hypothetical protein
LIEKHLGDKEDIRLGVSVRAFPERVNFGVGWGGRGRRPALIIHTTIP